MSDPTPQAPSGILGNTHAAAAAATTEREATKTAWQTGLVTQVVIGATFLVIAYILMYHLQWNFFLKMIVGYAIFYLSGKLAGFKSKILGSWPMVGRVVGIGIMALAVIQSSFFALAEKSVNIVEQKVAVVAGTATAGSQQQTGTTVVTPSYASPFYPEEGNLEPITLAPGQTSEEISAYDGMPVCWTTVPGLMKESKNDKGEWHAGVEQKAFAYRFTNPSTSKESLTVRPWRKRGSSCS